jgi:TRAP-type C4-dicarboxylate transport system substrate-binding protein
MRFRRFLPFLLLLVLVVAIAPAARAQGTVIKLATLVPEGSVWDKVLREMGSDWSTSTQNRVSLRIYPGGVAGDEPDVVRKMRIGQLHAAAITTAGLADIDPAFQIFNIPMFFDSYPELYAVLDKMEPLLKQRLDAKGFVLLNWGHGGWVYFFTKQPVDNIDALKKTKMFAWAGDDRMVQRWKANGFQPVALAATDILTGLSTGMIETYPSTPLIGLTLQWYRQTPYMVGVGLAPLVGGLVITKKAWGTIKPEDQAKLLAACDRVETRLMTEVPKQDTTAVIEMQKRGLTVTKVSPAGVEKFRASAQAFAASMRGDIVPADVLDMATRERDAFRKRGSSH